MFFPYFNVFKNTQAKQLLRTLLEAQEGGEQQWKRHFNLKRLSQQDVKLTGKFCSRRS